MDGVQRPGARHACNTEKEWEKLASWLAQLCCIANSVVTHMQALRLTHTHIQVRLQVPPFHVRLTYAQASVGYCQWSPDTI